MKFVLFILALTFISASRASADPKDRLYQRYLRIQNEALLERSGPGNTESIASFDQRIDHFSTPGARGAGATFPQRYFIDSSFARDQNSPVIFYICGESTCEGATSTSLVNQLARKYHAHRVALEHRYYGYSQPFSELTTGNLQFLSVAQAIEDLADFQRWAQVKLNLRGKWISVGGSYPGELSAFYRLRHPELVAGALASSAPVYAEADFSQYDRHVARVADPSCLRVIQKVVTQVEERLSNPTSRIAVKKRFQAQKVSNDTDFLYNLADMAAIAIQYGFQDEFCGALKKGDAQGKALEAYADSGLGLFQRLGTSPFQDAFEGAMSLNPNDYLESAGRQWMYQSCREFGFYQTAWRVPAESARSSRIDLAYHQEACNRLFGIKTPVNADLTNRTYYQQLFGAGVTHIFFTNGKDDPWSNLSLTDAGAVQNSNPGLSVFLIEGAAHCDDLGSRFSGALSEARARIDAAFGRYLSPDGRD